MQESSSWSIFLSASWRHSNEGCLQLLCCVMHSTTYTGYLTMQDSCRKATRDSVLHQADQVLRQCVSTELKAMKGSTALQVYSLIIDCWLCRELLQWLVSHCTAMQANAVRRQILEELRRENEWTTLQSPTDVDFREILMEKFSLLMKWLVLFLVTENYVTAPGEVLCVLTLQGVKYDCFRGLARCLHVWMSVGFI